TYRDPFTMSILIAVPLVTLLLFGFVLSTKVKHMALGVHDASDTPASRRLVADLSASGTFDPRPFATREELEHALVSGTVSAALVIPPDFARDLGDLTPGSARPEVQVLYDGGEAPLAGNAEAFLRALITSTGASLAERHRAGGSNSAGVGVVTRALFNPTLDGVPFMVSGTFGFVLSFLTTLITAVSIVNERQIGRAHV